MAGVLDALAPDVMKMIKDMVKDEFCMLLGVAGDIKDLNGNVKELQKILTDAERRRINEDGVQAWVSKLKNAMYEATDILDVCQLEAMDRQEEHKSSSSGGGWCFLEGALREKLHDCPKLFVGCVVDILQPFLFCAQNPVIAHEVGTRIKKLNNELAAIRKDAIGFKFNEEQRTLPTSFSLDPNHHPCETRHFVRSHLVGDQIEKNTQKLVQELIADHASSSSPVKVVAIVGMGGIGKSTLAKKVLASEAIGEDFKKIWLSVTPQFDKMGLLRSAISKAGGEPSQDNDEDNLVEALTTALSKKKFLLVLDDVWQQKAWDGLLQVPVLNAGEKQPGSRVLVTSRKRKIAEGMAASWIQEVHKLNNDDAWCLLKKQLRQPQASNSSVSVESGFDDLKDIGMKIVEKCDGLPLAIKVMGGLLSRKDPNKRQWKTILDKNLGWKDDSKKLNYSLSLSYDDLKPKWKQCFLYYSLFPKGSGFIEDRVISMWICEGLVQHDGRSELSIEEIGAEYHRELFARNLLERDDSTENPWDYTLHDVVRSFAEFIAKEEAFVLHKDKAKTRNLLLRNQKFHHISIFASKLDLASLENQETLRTLLIGCNIKPGGSLANFASLRVLDISSKKSDWLVESLCELRHLRYLSFTDTNISRLPGDIHKMRFLQHIQLDYCTNLENLPNSITKLVFLRYLSLVGTNVDVIPRGFGGLTNLRTLYGFPVRMDGAWCSLEELEAISDLRSLSVESLENVPDSSIAKRANISNKKSLEYLELNCYEDEEEDDDEEEEEEVDDEDDDDDDDDDDDVDDDDDDDEDDDDDDDEQEEGEEENEEGKKIEEGQKKRIEDVFDELCPPPMLETLIIQRYFGRRLPNWLQSPGATTFESLKTINLQYITYCIQLPNGLCRIHSLEELLVDHAPAIEHVEPDFQTLARGDGGIAFPKLRTLLLYGLSGWKKWDWKEQSKLIDMPALELLRLRDCKLTCLPRGLASDHRYNLGTIYLEELMLLECVENLPSVVTLHVHKCPELKSINGLSKLRMVCIEGCPELKLLKGVPTLERMDLDDEPWEVTGPDAKCTPKRYNQVTSTAVSQLLENLKITR